MSMTTRLAGSDYGVDASVGNRLSAGQAPKRASRGDKEEPHSENREDHHEQDSKTRKRKSERNEPVDVGVPVPT